MEIVLIKNNNPSAHVSLNTVKEFENSIIDYEKNKLPIKKVPRFITKSSYIVNKYSKKYFGFNMNPISSNSTKKKYFTILMGCDFIEAFPSVLLNANNYLYLFDAWEKNHTRIIEFVLKYNVKKVFVSAKQSANLLNNFNTATKFHWIPEAIDNNQYTFEEYSKKNIDIIQIGRKHEAYHSKIVAPLSQKNIKYKYEKIAGEIIFPVQKDFIKGLSKTKISICFPSNITHPERAGNIETMTVRYLQSIASKCLILGRAPQEMITLFGYNPVVNADFKNPSKQISDILNNFIDYVPIIEKNYNNLFNHNWIRRWERIKSHIAAPS